RKLSHSFTSHIKIIHVPTSKTVYAICKWYLQKYGEAYAMENTHCINKKDRLRPHFLNCLNLKEAISNDEYKKLIEITKPSKKKSKTLSESSSSKLINSQ
ncbi:6937_t:CDS:1, partial [Scutellospora calospora]